MGSQPQIKYKNEPSLTITDINIHLILAPCYRGTVLSSQFIRKPTLPGELQQRISEASNRDGIKQQSSQGSLDLRGTNSSN